MTSTPLRDAAGRRDLTGFYVVVALIALAGQAIAAVVWLGWHPLAAVLAGAALEFGGIVLSRHADARRRLGEHANIARLLSAGVAAFAIVFNWLGHTNHMQGGFFAGMSALGYGVWLFDSGARRRDQLRADEKLPPIAPAYGAIQWLQHPWLTRRARRLALVDPTLGLYGSLAAAAEQIRTERRRQAIATALHRRVRAAIKDPTIADIAIATYDLDEIAARLQTGADYDGLTALLAADLDPIRVAAFPVQLPSNAPVDVVDEHPLPAAEAEAAPEPEPAPVIDEIAAQPHRPRRLIMRHVGRAQRVVREHRRRNRCTHPTVANGEERASRPTHLTHRFARALIAGDPTLRRKDVAELLSISTRQLRNIVPTGENGSAAA